MSETTPKQSMEADVERRAAAAYVLALHDEVVEITATLNNGLEAQLIEHKAELTSVKDDIQLIRDPLRLLLIQARSRTVADFTCSPITAATSPRSIAKRRTPPAGRTPAWRSQCCSWRRRRPRRAGAT